MLRDEPIFINGDGESSRDFCFVDNAVQANLLAALTSQSEAVNQIYNVAVGDRTTLNELYELLRNRLAPSFLHLKLSTPIRRDFRECDVRHSLADIGKARQLLGYEASHPVGDGLTVAMDWYVQRLSTRDREMDPVDAANR